MEKLPLDVHGSASSHLRDEVIPLEDLKWSLICVAFMDPANRTKGQFESFDGPQPHHLLVKASYPPCWIDSPLVHIPLIGPGLNIGLGILRNLDTTYEDVADFLAADLDSGSQEWVGLKLGIKD